MLFELLTGRHPFEDDPSRDVLTHHLVSVPPEAHELAPGVPAALSALVRACLHKAAAERPSAAELGNALRAFANESQAPLAVADIAPRQHTEQRTAIEGRRRLPLASGAD